MRRFLTACATLMLLLATAELANAATPRRRPRRSLPLPPDLVWHVETLDGQPVSSYRGDEAINPASVVKVATTLWALDSLGPEYRWETRVWARGRVDKAKRTLFGDLVVQGSGDPDFHAENAFLLARALNEMGIERVTGALIVNSRFWIGWENGSEGREADPIKRGMLMATRLRQAFNPRGWDRMTRWAWKEFSTRRNWTMPEPPRVTVARGIGVDGTSNLGTLLVVHRSQPLMAVLRRFNCFSNNDIERIGENIGPVSKLTDLVASRTAVPRESVVLATASGLGTNRLTPLTVVRLLRELRAQAGRDGIRPELLLPVAGCGPSTVTRFFPELSVGPNATALVGKTGTLTTTDGGIAALAGFVKTAQGEFVFCVASPRAGRHLKGARDAEEKWVVDFLAGHGGGEARQCGPELAPPDAGAAIMLVEESLPEPIPAQPAVSGAPLLLGVPPPVPPPATVPLLIRR